MNDMTTAPKSGKKKTFLTIVLIIILAIVGRLLFKDSSNGVQVGDTVSIEFSAYLEDGTLFDSNQNGELLSFTVGAGEVIQGIDEGVVGMRVGKEKTIVVSPEKGYGMSYNPRKVQSISMIVFENLNITPEIGKYYKLGDVSGIVTSIEGEEGNQTVMLDTNAPETQQKVKYEILVKSIME